MPKQRKKDPDIDLDQVITVQSVDGVLQRTFHPEIIQCFRYMSTELTMNKGFPRRVAMIAALRCEGVTHTATALGATLASDTGASVCVVELNWWTPGLIALLDPRLTVVPPASKKKGGKKADLTPPLEPILPDHPGLAMVLTDQASLDQAIIHTSIPNFDLLPAGEMPITKRPSTARSTLLRQILDLLSERYDHLILDIPAVRTTSDAIVLAALGDACIVVARQGATSLTRVQQALDDVKSLTMLGVVLNKVAIYTPSWIRGLVPQE